jgi:pachytene checkpoint protein 2
LSEKVSVRIAECVIRNDVVTPAGPVHGWEGLVLPEEVTDRLLYQALLSLRLRAAVPFSTTALHGLITLYGPPGNGKTTLARGLARAMAQYVDGGQVRLIEVSPHGLMSAEHGQSQQRVSELLADHVPSLADDGMPTVVVLDEVESMSVARSAASLSANPADVHRATDAVLTALDANASEHPHLLMVATSNFTEALDTAFLSRSDVAICVPPPSAEAIRRILSETLKGLADAFPKLAELAISPGLTDVASALDGLDGRQVRKFITTALTLRLEVVLDPGKLTLQDLRIAAGKLADVRSQGSLVGSGIEAA